MNYDLSTWTQFFKDNWIILAVALAVLLAVMGIVKTVAKWALVAVIVIGVVVYSGYSLQDVKDFGVKMSDTLKQQAVSAMVGEADNATFTNNGDGTFSVKTNNLELKGKNGTEEVEVTYRGTSLGSWKIDDAIQQLIKKAKENV